MIEYAPLSMPIDCYWCLLPSNTIHGKIDPDQYDPSFGGWGTNYLNINTDHLWFNNNGVWEDKGKIKKYTHEQNVKLEPGRYEITFLPVKNKNTNSIDTRWVSEVTKKEVDIVANNNVVEIDYKLTTFNFFYASVSNISGSHTGYWKMEKYNPNTDSELICYDDEQNILSTFEPIDNELSDDSPLFNTWYPYNEMLYDIPFGLYKITMSDLIRRKKKGPFLLFVNKNKNVYFSGDLDYDPLIEIACVTDAVFYLDFDGSVYGFGNLRNFNKQTMVTKIMDDVVAISAKPSYLAKPFQLIKNYPPHFAWKNTFLNDLDNNMKLFKTYKLPMTFSENNETETIILFLKENGEVWGWNFDDPYNFKKIWSINSYMICGDCSYKTIQEGIVTQCPNCNSMNLTNGSQTIEYILGGPTAFIITKDPNDLHTYVYGWGYNDTGLLNINKSIKSISSPTYLPHLSSPVLGKHVKKIVCCDTRLFGKSALTKPLYFDTQCAFDSNYTGPWQYFNDDIILENMLYLYDDNFVEGYYEPPEGIHWKQFNMSHQYCDLGLALTSDGDVYAWGETYKHEIFNASEISFTEYLQNLDPFVLAYFQTIFNFYKKFIILHNYYIDLIEMCETNFPEFITPTPQNMINFNIKFYPHRLQKININVENLSFEEWMFVQDTDEWILDFDEFNCMPDPNINYVSNNNPNMKKYIKINHTSAEYLKDGDTFFPRYFFHCFKNCIWRNICDLPQNTQEQIDYRNSKLDLYATLLNNVFLGPENFEITNRESAYTLNIFTYFGAIPEGLVKEYARPFPYRIHTGLRYKYKRYDITKINTPQKALDIAAGYQHYMILLNDKKTIYGCGMNHARQLFVDSNNEFKIKSWFSFQPNPTELIKNVYAGYCFSIIKYENIEKKDLFFGLSFLFLLSRFKSSSNWFWNLWITYMNLITKYNSIGTVIDLSSKLNSQPNSIQPTTTFGFHIDGIFYTTQFGFSVFNCFRYSSNWFNPLLNIDGYIEDDGSIITTAFHNAPVNIIHKLNGTIFEEYKTNAYDNYPIIFKQKNLSNKNLGLILKNNKCEFLHIIKSNKNDLYAQKSNVADTYFPREYTLDTYSNVGTLIVNIYGDNGNGRWSLNEEGEYASGYQLEELLCNYDNDIPEEERKTYYKITFKDIPNYMTPKPIYAYISFHRITEINANYRRINV